MGNILSKRSFDKKEEEFEKMLNENFQSSNMFVKKERSWLTGRSLRNCDYALVKSHVRKQWFSDQQIDDQDLDFSKYWSFLPTNDPCFQPEKTK